MGRLMGRGVGDVAVANNRVTQLPRHSITTWPVVVWVVRLSSTLHTNLPGSKKRVYIDRRRSAFARLSIYIYIYLNISPPVDHPSTTPDAQDAHRPGADGPHRAEAAQVLVGGPFLLPLLPRSWLPIACAVHESTLTRATHPSLPPTHVSPVLVVYVHPGSLETWVMYGTVESHCLRAGRPKYA